MKHTIFTLFTATLLLAACTITTEPTDGPNYTNTVTGYALTTDSLDPIPNLVLKINPMQGSYTTPVGGTTVRTDSTGRFEFIYTGPSYGKIGIGFSGNSSYHNLAGYDYITPFTTKTHNIHLQPYGWLKLHVKNVNPWNGDDTFGVSAGSNSEVLYGVIDQQILWKVPGNGDIVIHWTVKRNNITNQFSDTVYVVGIDTLHYEILY